MPRGWPCHMSQERHTELSNRDKSGGYYTRLHLELCLHVWTLSGHLQVTADGSTNVHNYLDLLIAACRESIIWKDESFRTSLLSDPQVT